MFAGAHWTFNRAAGLGFLNEHRDEILRDYGDSLDTSTAQENTWTSPDTDVASGSWRKSGKSDTQPIALCIQESNLLIMTTNLLLKTQHLILLLTAAAGLLGLKHEEIPNPCCSLHHKTTGVNSTGKISLVFPLFLFYLSKHLVFIPTRDMFPLYKYWHRAGTILDVTKFGHGQCFWKAAGD